MRWSLAPPKDPPWKRWFAWKPVEVPPCSNNWVWLEVVERRKEYDGWSMSRFQFTWNYRLRPQTN